MNNFFSYICRIKKKCVNNVLGVSVIVSIYMLSSDSNFKRYGSKQVTNFYVEYAFVSSVIY